MEIICLFFQKEQEVEQGKMIEGKKGILLVARDESKAKIIPIGMCGTDKLLPINKDG